MAAHSSCNCALANPIISRIDSSSKQKKPSVPLYFFSTRNPLTNPWLGVVDSSSLSLTSPVSALQTNRRRIHKSVISSLPTANPDSVVSDAKKPKWSWRAIKSFAMGELEARKLKYPNTGTEALLMGILIEGTSFTSKFLRANNIMLYKVREETIKLLGKADLYFFSPEHPPLTEDAQRALDSALDQNLKAGSIGEVMPAHILLGIWSEVDSPGHKILATLGFTDEKSKELESFASKSGFLDE
ncbi:PREDICTED: ATP-dependent Clp protease ATP-binding subunit CLPT2, chloroplastic-like [Camelina sativa]|uniref:ATP-dependent Clp protease ATP-binding subunit CLPT2, chloroplastic-like n=1 Tax=Camelina sativa TaxID=90675 RepID=A0ABM0T7T8_CAMSA|nr:PREDICTED: ATP-dependent Clp protease ATP-binding subunit CLPT2, chloroplastic-like [Camelina sativa]